jgi:hypothetical protein
MRRLTVHQLLNCLPWLQVSQNTSKFLSKRSSSLVWNALKIWILVASGDQAISLWMNVLYWWACDKGKVEICICSLRIGNSGLAAKEVKVLILLHMFHADKQARWYVPTSRPSRPWSKQPHHLFDGDQRKWPASSPSVRVPQMSTGVFCYPLTHSLLSQRPWRTTGPLDPMSIVCEYHRECLTHLPCQLL